MSDKQAIPPNDFVRQVLDTIVNDVRKNLMDRYMGELIASNGDIDELVRIKIKIDVANDIIAEIFKITQEVYSK